VAITDIGFVADGTGVTVLAQDGETMNLAVGGYAHF